VDGREADHAQEISKFVVTNASKRGWTTWLAGAIDPRVIGIAPMVIDTLNMSKQMPFQEYAWGTYSSQIDDYTALRLPDRLSDPAARRLLELVDPWSYREALAVPKLILIGTNDAYWPVDAIKHYYGKLPGEKAIHYVPNAGHDLGNGLSAMQAVSAFWESFLEATPRPRFDWKLRVDATPGSEKKTAVLEVVATDPAQGAELWTAHAETRDFRSARFSKVPLEADGKTYRAVVETPASGRVAFYVNLLYESASGRRYGLATNVEVLDPNGVDFPENLPARATAGSPREAGAAAK